MTWLSFCARRSGPGWKQGYGTGDRTLRQIEGVVDHSMEGSLAGAYGVLDGPEQSSWTFSIPKVGEPIQHYSLKKIPWHAGLPGDRRQDTSLIGNLTLIGKEHEGVAGEPWTENQLHWSAKIDVACRALCPTFGKHPPVLRLNMWEHRWLSVTSCPSGRNPWNAKFALINELEDGDMALEFYKLADGKVFMVGLAGKRHISPKEWEGHREAGYKAKKVGDEAIKAIPTQSGGGLTEEEAVEASKRAAREGTG